MGYMRHHAIIVSSSAKEKLEEAHFQAGMFFPWVSPISPDIINGERSFFIPPDGSKEGWSASDEGDKDRDLFIEWIDNQRYEDDSTSLAWVEVQYGDDEGETMIVRDSDERMRERNRMGG